MNVAPVNCPACLRSRLRVWCEASPLDYSLDGPSTVVRCDSCGYGRTVPGVNLPGKDTSFLYEEGAYNPVETSLQRAARPLLVARARRMAALIRSLAQGKRLLEIGAGKGRFLLGAMQAGFEVRGIEPSGRGRAFARALCGAVVTDHTLKAFARDSVDRFDVVCAWHVMEHVNDIDEALGLVRMLLTPSGLFCFAVPNFASPQAKGGRANWYHLDPPRHQHHFSPEGLVRLLGAHGFTNVRFDWSNFLEDFTGELLTTLNRVSLHKNALLNAVKRNPLYFRKTGMSGWGTIAWNMLLLPAALPLCLLTTLRDERRQAAGTMLVFARAAAL